ncbi:MAG: hypothetical protein LBB17_03330 [Puniceicoccales bacterium]|nr:hypothetical protein [Puniceicoccales bacterium]
MNNINSNGLNKFFNIVQKGVDTVTKVVPKLVEKTLPLVTTGMVAKAFSKTPPICVPLMQKARPLVQALAQPSSEFFTGQTFPENHPVPISDMFQKWDPEYIEFIQTHCMKPFEWCVGPGVSNIEDPDKVFIARSEFAPDISVERAKRFKFILPSNIDERVKRNPNLKVRPLMIRCFGVGSGNTLKQIKEGAGNVLSLPTDRLESANALILSHIESKQQEFKSDPNVLVVPFITGFSLGGMFANAIAVKNNFTSITVNGLGLGESGCKFVGEKNWKRAQQQSNSHIAMFVDQDFVASSDSAWRGVTKIPGHIVRIPSNNPNPTISQMTKIHFYKNHFNKALQDYRVSCLPAANRLIA